MRASEAICPDRREASGHGDTGLARPRDWSRCRVEHEVRHLVPVREVHDALSKTPERSQESSSASRTLIRITAGSRSGDYPDISLMPGRNATRACVSGTRGVVPPADDRRLRGG